VCKFVVSRPLSWLKVPQPRVFCLFSILIAVKSYAGLFLSYVAVGANPADVIFDSGFLVMVMVMFIRKADPMNIMRGWAWNRGILGVGEWVLRIRKIHEG
jgi:hypothetical protein